LYASRLQQFANNTIRLRPVSLEQHHGTPLIAERYGQRAADDASSYNHSIWIFCHEMSGMGDRSVCKGLLNVFLAY
jgi:hypothetical protein